jgi:predicted TIM-barrel fold metal-dependent hydrolase
MAVVGGTGLTALFGSDFPVITPDRWMASFEELDVRAEARP